MVEENKKPEKRFLGQIVIGDDCFEVDQTSDAADSKDNLGSDAAGFDTEATRGEDVNPVISSQATSLGTRIEPGTVIDNRYRLVYLAGNGATGQVWHAHDMHMGYSVAIKLISPRFQTDPEVLDRFRDSFKVVHDLHHRYICPLNHMGNDERFGWYLVMQWMPETLSSFREALEARKQTMSQEMIRTIISMLAEGLDYVHELRIIHRDIKPANIVITRNKSGDFNTAQLIDFGLSQDLDEVDDETVACGTPAYMAPEQWSNSFQDGSTDQYALAMVAYELYCGHPAFSAPSYELMKSTVLNDMPAPLPDLPPYVNHALLKALSKDRDDRYASCSEFAKALAPPPTFYEKNIIGILTMTILFLAVCLFSMFSFLRPSSYTQQVMTYSQSERTFTFGKPGDMLSFLVIHDENSPQAENKPSDNTLPVSDTSPQLTIGNDKIDLTKASHGKGWATSAVNAENIVLTLDGYSGESITATALNLKIVLADGTENVVKSQTGQVGLEIHDGNLTVTGSTRGTGKLSIICEAPSTAGAGEQSVSSCPAAILVGGKGRSLTLEQFASLHIQTSDKTDGISVERGNVNIHRVASVDIACSKDRNSILAENMSVIASKKSELVLAGGLCLQDPLSVFDAEKPNVPITLLPFVFKLCDATVDRLAGTQAELIEALAHISTDTTTVILLTDDIETSPRLVDSDHSVSVLTVARGHHVLLSSGHRVIRKGPEHSRDEELLFIEGRLSLGAPSGMGTSTLMLDGGCEREVAAQEPITFNYEDGRTMEIAKYSVSGSSAVCLVSVNGFLNLYDGVVIANNVNPKSDPNHDKTTLDIAQGAGGVFVSQSGTFEMMGGRIQNCEAPYGGGVSVRGVFRLKGGMIIGNTVNNGNGEYSTEGGGVFVKNGRFEMSGGTICDNLALSRSSGADGGGAKGAGIHLSFDSECKLTGGVIRDNHSMWGGGGIYAGGRGSSTLEISENIRIENNTAVVGAGVFMNAPVKMSGGSIAKNTLYKGPSVSLPAGAGFYFLPVISTLDVSFPCLFLGGNASISPDNHIYISSVNRLNSEKKLMFDERFYPIILTSPLTGDPASQHFTIDGGMFTFTERNDVPLVGLRFSKTANAPTAHEVLEHFSFGFLGVPENKNFKLICQNIDLRDIVTSKTRREQCLSVTPK